jgi:ABC-2 type transport system ATP-binding protein
MTAPHAVLKKFPPPGKPKSPGLAAVEIRDLSKHFGPATTVRAQDPVRLTGTLERRGHRVDRDGDVLNVLGATPEEVGEIAGHEQLAVLGLAPRTRSLEEAFFALTGVQS